MKISTGHYLAAALMFAGVPALAAEPVRIDGTTDETFDASFQKLVKSLKAPERRTLALGLFGALVPHECLTSEAIVALTFSPVTPKDAPRIRSCREQLHNKSYQDILEAAEPAPSGPAAALPNNSFKPKPLRGSA